MSPPTIGSPLFRSPKVRGMLAAPDGTAYGQAPGLTMRDIIARHYSDSIQMGLGQVAVIAQAITASGPGANVLVFGCGNDSMLWHAVNQSGYTLFLEQHENWIQRTRQRWPDLNIEQASYGDRTVATSLPLSPEELARYETPESLRARRWDVIVIDAPMGNGPEMPGRSLPIYWASLIADEATHVFVDDYHRRLERTYGDYFFRSKRLWNVEIPRVFRGKKPSKEIMLWSVGLPSSLAG